MIGQNDFPGTALAGRQPATAELADPPRARSSAQQTPGGEGADERAEPKPDAHKDAAATFEALVRAEELTTDGKTASPLPAASMPPPTEGPDATGEEIAQKTAHETPIGVEFSSATGSRRARTPGEADGPDEADQNEPDEPAAAATITHASDSGPEATPESPNAPPAAAPGEPGVAASNSPRAETTEEPKLRLVTVKGTSGSPEKPSTAAIHPAEATPAPADTEATPIDAPRAERQPALRAGSPDASTPISPATSDSTARQRAENLTRAEAPLSPTATPADGPLRVLSVAAPPDAAAAQERLAVDISRQITGSPALGGRGTLDIRLDPPELGRVTLHLTVSDDRVTAHLAADRPDTIDLIRRHADLLQRDLTAAGYRNVTLDFGQPGERGAQAEPGSSGPTQAPSEAAEASAPVLWRVIAAPKDRLDIRI